MKNEHFAFESRDDADIRRRNKEAKKFSGVNKAVKKGIDQYVGSAIDDPTIPLKLNNKDAARMRKFLGDINSALDGFVIVEEEFTTGPANDRYTDSEFTLERDYGQYNC